MRILIDTTQIPRGRTGVGIYGEQLIKAIASVLHPQDRLYVLVQSDDISFRNLISTHNNLYPLVIASPLFRNRLALATYEQLILPWILLYRRIDLVHSLHYTFPLICPCFRIVTIHDLTFSLWPQMHTLGRRLIMPFFTKMAMRHAEGVLFVSESTRNDAERLFGRGTNLRWVSPLGVDQSCFEEIKPEEIKETLSRLDIQQPYILFLGTIEPRKNVTRLVQAFEVLGTQSSQYTLIIAGKLGWGYQETLQAIQNSPVNARIHHLGYVAAGDKALLVAGCELLVYPSLYEGFGLPVLEGMAAGVPVITGNVSSLPEVAGEAAVMIDPTSVDQIASAINLVLSNKSYANTLRQAGKGQAKKFTWKRTAEVTYAAYRTACLKFKEPSAEPLR